PDAVTDGTGIPRRRWDDDAHQQGSEPEKGVGDGREEDPAEGSGCERGEGGFQDRRYTGHQASPLEVAQGAEPPDPVRKRSFETGPERSGPVFVSRSSRRSAADL